MNELKVYLLLGLAIIGTLILVGMVILGNLPR